MMLWIFVFLHITSANDWLLYSTDKAYGDHDCLFYDSRFFCRRPADGIIVRKSICNGIVWSMMKLKENNVTTDMLFDWLQPHDNIEQYARFLQNSFEDNSFLGNEVICNCSSNEIGVDCSYELVEQSTVNQVLSNQLKRPYERNAEIIACLVDDIQCNSGLLCLEWRQICDGVVQCENGMDEANCDLLEFHRCASNEFQCLNKMCIPKEFLFDGTIDCMDKSDEQEIQSIFDFFTNCPSKSKFDCDEFLCKKNEYSCGDGQCIHWTNLIHHRKPCQNRRNAFYRCEILMEGSAFTTLQSGTCRSGKGNTVSLTSCTIGLQLLLGKYYQQKMFEYLRDNCSSFIPFPSNSILTSNLKFFYNRTIIEAFYNSFTFEKSISPLPHVVCLTGSSICNGSKVTLNSNYCFGYDEFLALAIHPFFPITEIFCNVTSSISLNVTIEHMSQYKNKHYEQPFYQCRHSSNIISLKRINDGYIDCLLGDDEMNMDYLPINEPYRYQCTTTDQPQYVSVQLLGNGVKDCLDGSDELSPKLHWPFFRCEYENDYPCWIFRNKENINEVQLLFHRHCDSIWDTMDGRDEQNCLKWVCPIDMYQCNGTGQCIDKKYLCDEEFDCANGEDEFKCPDKKGKPYWILKDKCDDSNEYFCITLVYLKNLQSKRPCISVSKVGNGIIDCIGGRDERNLFSCSDHEMLGDRFLCDNETRCISYQGVCNGVNDCIDGSDEYICYWNRNKSCRSDQFACMDGSCVQERCQNTATGCKLQNEHLLWCPSSSSLKTENYRSNKIRRPSNYGSFCNIQESTSNPAILPMTSNMSAGSSVSDYNRLFDGYCGRGFYLWTKNRTLPVCFCPPSYYGNQCQFNRRRITVRFRVDRFSALNIPPVLHILVSLIYNDTIIVDHTTRVDAIQDFASKHDIHLLYSRPKLDGCYSVRFEAYAGLELLTAWEYAISPLEFLPALRLATILRFPEAFPQYCSENPCKNNGTCHVVNNYERNRYICVCQREWTGKHCEQPKRSQKCSLQARTPSEDLCICPEGYLLPNCFVRNTICETKRPCLSNEICVAHSTRYADYTCVCTTSNCREEKAFLTITGKNFTNHYPLVIQLLKFSSGYPRLQRQLLISSLFEFPVIRAIDAKNPQQDHPFVPEIGLLYTFNRTSSVVFNSMSLLYISCSNTLHNLTVDLDTQLRFCHSVEESFSSVQTLHMYCRIKNAYSCFYTTSYVCYCSSINNGSECISYRQRENMCSNCLNQGLCAQGDLQNRSDFECICPVCVTGDLCQFSLRRFSVTFEWLIEKSQWGRMHLITPIIFLTIGFVFNSLTIATLSQKKARSNGVGAILLFNSFVSLFLLILFLIRVIYLQVLRHTSSINTTSIILCKVLPYFMSSMSYFSAWLMALVTLERAIISRVTMTHRFIESPKVAVIICLIICMCILTSFYKQIEQYKLIAHPNSNIWCVQEISLNQQLLFQIISIVHQLIPFLVNFVSAIVIIITMGHLKAASHHLPASVGVAQQARERLDLLLGPFICFICQLPQLIMLFLNPCTYDDKKWFSHVALTTYFITFIPHISLFFMYIIPSSLYKELFVKMIRRNN